MFKSESADCEDQLQCKEDRPMASKMKLGFLNSAKSEAELRGPIAAFRRGMSQAGVEKRYVALSAEWANHDSKRLPGLAAVEAATNSSRPVRVVFVGGFDPVEAGLVDHLERPSGNATGVSTSTTESLPMRLQLAGSLRNAEVVFLVKPDTLLARLERERMNGTYVVEAASDDELQARFREAKEKEHTIVLGADVFFTSRRKPIAKLADKYKVPAVYPFREYVEEADGLMSYGPSLANAYRQAGVYAGQLLLHPGEPNPPVVHPSIPELAINLKAAHRLKLMVPHELLARATYVVEDAD
jgi:putative tryptophan/tyrosine transport system substrate-binding protein